MDVYRSIFECAPDAVLVVDRDGCISRVNARAEATFRYGRDELIGRAVEILIPERFAARHVAHRTRYLQEPRLRPMGANLDLYGKRKDGSEFPVDLMLSPLQTSEGPFVLVVVRDITEQRAVVERQRFVALADASLEFIGMCDRELRPFYVNPAGMRLVGLESLEAACRVKVQEYFFPEDQPFITGQFFPGVMREGHGEVEIRFRHFQTGEAIWMLYNVFSLRDPRGEVVGWATVSRNIHDRKKAEEALRESESRLRLAQQVGHIGAFEWNVQTGVNTWTRELESMHGLGPGEFGRTQQYWEQLVHPEDRSGALQVVRQALATGLPTEGEWRVVWPDGSTRWVVGRFQAFHDEAGKPLRLAGVNLDITERRLAEEQLRRARDQLELRVRERTAELVASLREKEVLLKEIHHRVKNNLAVISSLFYLQSTYTSDGPTLRTLQECQDRVRSMALVHETLYQSGRFSALDFATYSRVLSDHLFRSYGAAAEVIRLKTDLGKVSMSIDLAVPCGFILNELVSNALKHAFPHGRGGEITIRLRQAANGICTLQVADDGVGIPADLDVKAARSLGLRLIRSLTRQVHGQFELLPANPGTEARLTFRVNHDAN